MAKRSNGEGSIYPYRNGYAAHVWVVTPQGQRKRKTVYGKTRKDVHAKWVKLHRAAANGPVPTSSPNVASYLDYWLREVVIVPDYAPMTVATYKTFVKHYIAPYLGKKKLDKLTVKDLRLWVNTLRKTCQCCAQGKDTSRLPRKQRCCAIGKCCGQITSESNIYEARKILRSALSNAQREELVSRNVAQLLKTSKPRSKKTPTWSLEEVQQFLESARADNDPLYAAYVLILVLGLRKGEVLGLVWECVDLDNAELSVEWQLQRVANELLHRQTKTQSSNATLPLPDLCVAALRTRAQQQAATVPGARKFVFTATTGQPVDPRGFNRRFDKRCEEAGVRRISVHTTRRTCATLLAALDVHPRVAMRILRHSQITLTMDVYSEVQDESTQTALKKLSGTVEGTVGREPWEG